MRTSPRIAFLGLTALMIVSGGVSSIRAADIGLAWDPVYSPNNAGYRLHSGTTSGVYTQISEVGNTTSTFVSNLVVGQTYYFVVTAYNSTGVESSPSNEIAYTAIQSSPTPTPSPTVSPNPTATPSATPIPTPSPTPTPIPTVTPSSTATPSPTPTPSTAQMLNPAPGSTLRSSTVTFNWSAGGATAYSLVVGTSPGMGNIYSSGSITSQSATVSNLPTNGHPIYVSLWSLVNNSWSANKYTYTASTTSPSPTPTPLGSPSPTPTPTPTPTVTPSPTATPSPTPVVSPSPPPTRFRP